jgi:hypothetical protein
MTSPIALRFWERINMPGVDLPASRRSLKWRVIVCRSYVIRIRPC